MRAGRLRHRLQLQRAVEARNGYGEVIQAWSTAATVWGSAEPLQGREYQLAKQTQAETMMRFRIRYRTDVRPSWRVVCDGRNYDIVDAQPDERRVELHLMCVDVVEGA